MRKLEEPKKLSKQQRERCTCESCKRAKGQPHKIAFGQVHNYSELPDGGWQVQHTQSSLDDYALGVELETMAPPGVEDAANGFEPFTTYCQAHDWEYATSSHQPAPAWWAPSNRNRWPGHLLCHRPRPPEIEDFGPAGPVTPQEAATMARPEGFWLPKHDGSVTGPEYASQPATLDWWYEHRTDLGEMFTMLLHGGYRSHEGDQAGMHVNISTTAFGTKPDAEEEPPPPPPKPYSDEDVMLLRDRQRHAEDALYQRRQEAANLESQRRHSLNFDFVQVGTPEILWDEPAPPTTNPFDNLDWNTPPATLPPLQNVPSIYWSQDPLATPPPPYILPLTTPCTCPSCTIVNQTEEMAALNIIPFPTLTPATPPPSDLEERIRVAQQRVDAAYRSYTRAQNRFSEAVNANDEWAYQLTRQRTTAKYVGAKEHLSRFLDLVYINKQWSRRMSQRTLSSLHWATLDALDDPNRRNRWVNRAIDEGYSDDNRYVAVNRPDGNRFEFRLPRGTLRLDRFYKNLEWTHAMIEYTRTADAADCTPPKFMAWVLRNPEYPYLRSFIEEKFPSQIERQKLAPEGEL